MLSCFGNSERTPDINYFWAPSSLARPSVSPGSRSSVLGDVFGVYSTLVHPQDKAVSPIEEQSLNLCQEEPTNRTQHVLLSLLVALHVLWWASTFVGRHGIAAALTKGRYTPRPRGIRCLFFTLHLKRHKGVLHDVTKGLELDFDE